MHSLGEPSVSVQVDIELLAGTKTGFGFEGITQLSMRMETGVVQNLYGNTQRVPLFTSETPLELLYLLLVCQIKEDIL